MGIDGFVPCNCVRLGTATPPPLPVHFSEHGGFFEPDGDRMRDPSASMLIYDWQRTACPHRDCWFASEHVSNWSGFRAFQHALLRLGSTSFPTLLAELPNRNDGHTGSDRASAILAELAAFELLPAWSVATLMDGDAGKEAYRATATLGGSGTFVWSGKDGLEIGISHERGMLHVTGRDGQVLFEARDIAQVVETDPSGRFSQTVLTNLETEREFRLTTAIPGATWTERNGLWISNYPSHLFVERCTEGAHDFAHILAPLRRLFEASRQVDNPVYWA